MTDEAANASNAAVSDADGTGTLYDRIGGADAVSKLIYQFYQRVMADPVLSPFFTDTPTDTLESMQSEFFATALGGPVRYTGRPLSEVHAGLGIKTHHLKRFLDHLLETLEGFEITGDDRYDIVSRINTYADEITGGTSVDG